MVAEETIAEETQEIIYNNIEKIEYNINERIKQGEHSSPNLRLYKETIHKKLFLREGRIKNNGNKQER